MTQSATLTGRGPATPEEISWGRRMREHYRTPARMRDAAQVLKHPTPKELRKLGAVEGPSWGEQAALLEREAQRWESEGLIDCT